MPDDVKNKPKINKKKKEYHFDFDELKMYFSEPYIIAMENGDCIEILQPSIGKILELGDREVYSCISTYII